MTYDTLHQHQVIVLKPAMLLPRRWLENLASRCRACDEANIGAALMKRPNETILSACAERLLLA